MAKPDFLVIGAQKAGTTWLDKMFKSHPNIWTPVVKELQFFNTYYMPEAFKWNKAHRESHALKAISYAINEENRNKIDWNKIKQATLIGEKDNVDYSWYQSVFDYAPVEAIKGEMTPEYSLLNEEHVKDVVGHYPEIKIILVMRDPLQRALSGIKMRLLQQGYTNETNQEEVDNFVISCASDWDVIERGNYERIMNTWLKFIDKKQFLPLLSESLKKDGKQQLAKVSRFLALPESEFIANANVLVHVGKSYNISQHAIDEVATHQEKNTIWFSEYIKNV
ncbi:sulfotransferase [Paraglaciecola sp.]|uniref:sulfotransferase n=1 Tax=Paraglaciecola sp. TaxID=1920173 RepID=UPI0032677EF6